MLRAGCRGGDGRLPRRRIGVLERLTTPGGRPKRVVVRCAGEVIVDALVPAGTVGDVADAFELTLDDLLAVARLGESNATKILAGIERAKSLPLGRMIAALGIKGTGRSMSRRLASHFS